PDARPPLEVDPPRVRGRKVSQAPLPGHEARRLVVTRETVMEGAARDRGAPRQLRTAPLLVIVVIKVLGPRGRPRGPRRCRRPAGSSRRRSPAPRRGRCPSPRPSTTPR